MKKIISVFIAIMLLLSSVTVIAQDIKIDLSSGLKYYSSMVSSEEEYDGSIHETYYPIYENHNLASPSIFSDYTEPTRELIDDADFYVATDGSDETGDGSFDNPFASLERARSAVRELVASGRTQGGITIAVKSGTYQVSSTFSMSSADSGTADSPITYTAYGDGEVIFKGSVSIDPEDFVPVGDDIKSRLTDEAAEAVRMVDLTKYGITSSMLSYNQTSTQTGGGTNVELTMNRKGFELARYPNTGWLYSNTTEEGASKAKYTVSDEIMDRVESWATTDDVCGISKPILEWNDASSRVSFDFNTNVITFKDFRQSRGDESLPFYFFNVLDELDVPGEWYIDRDNCIAYIWAEDGYQGAEFELNVSFGSNFISMSGVSYVTLDGFTFIGTRGSGISANSASHVNILNCKLYNIGSNGIEMYGDNILVQGNELAYLGHHGIVVGGGSKATLTKCYITVDNNLVEHWALYRRTFTTAIDAAGQGITVSHNDMGYSTSNALGMQGNLNVAEYNLVHDCCTLASDCGAFYNGSSWTSGSNDLRYNAFYNIGTDKEAPAAIYWDDGMAYQRAYGNLIVNVSGYGFSIGGGFGTVVTNNLVLNSGYAPFLYDGRPYYGNISGDSFYTIGGFIWNLYKSTPYESTVWQENFPLLSQVLQSNSDKYAPHYGYNPAFSLFSDNIFVNYEANSGGIGVQHVWYSTFIDNYAATQDALEEIFVNPNAGDYRIKADSEVWETVRDFEEIPYHLMGRY